MQYPSLYYKETFKKSRNSVLRHLYTVIGSGTIFIKDKKYFSFGDKIKISKKTIARILDNEKIVKVGDIAKLSTQLGIFPDINKSHKNKIYFLKDFLKKNIKHLKWGDKYNGENLDEYKVIEVYPEEEKYPFHPYPFSLEYVPFWNRKNKCFIPKNKILDDWRQGIVDIYTEYFNWFRDDGKWSKDHYYNCVDKPDFGNSDCIFTQNWNKALDKLKFCENYGIEPKIYDTPKEMAIDVVNNNRKKYIENCNKIIEFYK